MKALIEWPAVPDSTLQEFRHVAETECGEGVQCPKERKPSFFTKRPRRMCRTLTVNRSWIKLEFRSTMKLLKALSDFRS